MVDWKVERCERARAMSYLGELAVFTCDGPQ